MPLTTTECVADAVMVADKARKHDLANAIDISEPVESINRNDPLLLLIILSFMRFERD